MFLGIMWAAIAGVVGFMAGRISMYSMYGVWNGKESEEAGTKEVQPSEKSGLVRRGRGRHKEEERQVWSVGSPVAGQVTVNRDGERPVVVIRPDGDKLYAPVNGKITRLFPMGNAFLFSTEFGAEIYIQAGDAEDELLGRYYRPRIVQNEVVGKGKLILEFDRRGLEAEGASSEVIVSVESCSYGGDVRIPEREQVRTGEEILQVREPVVQGR